MSSICFYFQVHQPFRLKPYSFAEIGRHSRYDYATQNKRYLTEIAARCYLPANDLMYKLIKKYKGKFKISYAISGVALEQFELYKPSVITSFKKLFDTSCAELLSETYYHSLASVFDASEFEKQVFLHKQKVQELFGISPTTFRNTELIYSNDIALLAEKMGYQAILCEGVDAYLDTKTPYFLYQAPKAKKIISLLKHYRLSDDVAFRFTEPRWSEYPLTAEKYARWIHALANQTDVINLFMDYETIGEHKRAESGIFEFFEALPNEIFKHPDFDFCTPSEAIKKYQVKGIYDVPKLTSWADVNRDLSAWLGNPMQQEAIDRVYKLTKNVQMLDNQEAYHIWRQLQTSDHFYYMYHLPNVDDGKVHEYFSPFPNYFEAHINYMNVISDFKIWLERQLEKKNALPS